MVFKQKQFFIFYILKEPSNLEKMKEIEAELIENATLLEQHVIPHHEKLKRSKSKFKTSDDVRFF